MLPDSLSWLSSSMVKNRPRSGSVECPQSRAASGRLAELGVDMLICGAVSESLESLMIDSGIQVEARICGDLEAVLMAFRQGTLEEDRFTMPGCRDRRKRRAPHR